MIIVSVIFLGYLVKIKPFKQKLDNILNIVALIFLVILYLICFCFGCLEEAKFSSIRSYLGYAFIGIALLLFLFCVTIIVIIQLVNCVN